MMVSLIEEIEKCLNQQYLRCAIGMALTLPDICGQVEYPDEGRVGKRYIDWCNQYLLNQGFVTSSKSDNENSQHILSGDICYKLRCAFLHSGNIDLNQRKNDHYPFFELRISSAVDTGIFVEPYVVNDQGETVRFALDVRHLCHVLCNAAKEYYENHEPKSDFLEHQFSIVDVEEGARKNFEWKQLLCERQSKKTDISDIKQLSVSAKDLLQKISNRETDSISKKLKTQQDVHVIADMMELLQGGFIKISDQ